MVWLKLWEIYFLDEQSKKRAPALGNANKQALYLKLANKYYLTTMLTANNLIVQI